MHSDEREARLWQISENLHRADLTVLERHEQIAEWLRLIGNGPPGVSGQLVRKRRGGRPEGGLSLAARKLPVAGTSAEGRRKSVERAIRVDNISPKAKAEAVAVGLDNNQSALLAVARQSTPESQVRKVRDLAGRKRKPRLKWADPAEHGGHASSTETEQLLRVVYSHENETSFAWLKAAWRRASELVVAWARAPSSVRERFISEVLRASDADAPSANDEAKGTLGRTADHASPARNREKRLDHPERSATPG
jgi:ParB family chromosome partitioning protein